MPCLSDSILAANKMNEIFIFDIYIQLSCMACSVNNNFDLFYHAQNIQIELDYVVSVRFTNWLEQSATELYFQANH